MIPRRSQVAGRAQVAFNINAGETNNIDIPSAICETDALKLACAMATLRPQQPYVSIFCALSVTLGGRRRENAATASPISRISTT